jgi:TPR repeat protein
MKKLIIALFLIFATAVWAGDLEDGNAALSREDFIAAAEHFKRAANEGDPVSQYNLGLMYERGDGVHQDFA